MAVADLVATIMVLDPPAKRSRAMWPCFSWAKYVTIHSKGILLLKRYHRCFELPLLRKVFSISISKLLFNGDDASAGEK